MSIDNEIISKNTFKTCVLAARQARSLEEREESGNELGGEIVEPEQVVGRRAKFTSRQIGEGSESDSSKSRSFSTASYRASWKRRRAVKGPYDEETRNFLFFRGLHAI